MNHKKLRFGMIIELKSKYVEDYKSLHSGPGIRDLLAKSNITNFSIFLKKMPNGRYYEFAYYEYAGDDYDADMAILNKNPRNVDWLRLCDPMQVPLPGQKGWEQLNEIFYHE